MIRVAAVMAGLAMLLCGCVDGTADLGVSPPVRLTTLHREITMRTFSGRVSQRLRRDIDALASGHVQAVRARIVARDVPQAERAREILIGMGLDPAHVTAAIEPSRRASGTNIALTRTVAIGPDCAAAIEPAFPDDPGPSLFHLSQCVQANNLAAMVVDPADLVDPPRLGHADGAYLVNGVEAWRANRQSRLPAMPTADGIDSDTLGGGLVVSGAPATAAPGPSAATAPQNR